MRDQVEIEAIRRFNRFYTQHIGILGEGLLGSRYSLTEVRVLYELANRTWVTAAELSRELSLDPGYLSRIVRRFEANGLVTRRRENSDGRRHRLLLTAKGRREFAELNRETNSATHRMIAHIDPEKRSAVIRAMIQIEEALAPSPTMPGDGAILLRPHTPGDLGWIVFRHGVLYAREYGWNEEFEALVARIVSDFVDNHDPKLERCWIAERHGERLGSVMLVKKSKTVAKLRLLLVEPTARGLGLGKRLVGECIRFARDAGYRKLTLWTNDVLHVARRVYEDAGFELVASEKHVSFGKKLTSQTWELSLR